MAPQLSQLRRLVVSLGLVIGSSLWLASCGGGSAGTTSVASATAPTITSQTPAAAATNVAVNATLQVTFSEAMNDTSATSTSVTVTCGGTAISGTLSWDSAKTVLTFTPDTNYPEKSTCTASLSADLKDASGNPLTAASTTFTIGDFTAPTVSSVSPKDAATGVAVNTTVQVTFSEGMDTSSCPITLTCGGSSVTGSCSWNSDKTILTFTPTSKLSEQTSCSVSVPVGFKDAAANGLAAATSASFTTGDFTAPTVSSCTPAASATGVTKGTTVSCTLSEALDSTTVTSSTVTLKAGSTSVSGSLSLSSDKTSITFTPTSSLGANTQHTLTLTTGIKDLAGNALANNYTTSFTTKCSSSDAFDNPNTLTCFTLDKDTSGGLKQETSPGSFLDSLTIAGGTLTLDFNTVNSSEAGGGSPALMKQLASGDFEVEMLLTGGLPSKANETIGIEVTNGTTNDDNANIVLTTDGNSPSIYANSTVNGTNSVLSSTAFSGSQVYLKISRTKTTYAFSYKATAGASFTTLTSQNRTTANDSLGTTTDTLYVGVFAMTRNTLGTFIPVIDYFNFNSGSAASQE